MSVTRKPHNITTILKLFLALWLLIPVRALGEEAWCAITDTNHIVVLSNISYMASTVDSHIFSIVLNDGSAITGVESITFSMYHFDGIDDIEIDSSAELKFDGDKIVISHAKVGSKLSIVTLDGRTLLSSSIDSHTQEVDITDLASGVYILNVDGKPVKFKRL